MGFCRQCGKKLDDGLKFCPECGARVENQDAVQEKRTVVSKTKVKTEKTSTSTQSGEFSHEDINANKTMAVLAYIIFLVPLFAAKESKFARYHTNQSIMLWLTNITLGIVVTMLMFSGSAVAIVLSIVLGIGLGIGIIVLYIMGIVHAVKGEVKPLPFIGKFTILKF